MEVLKIVKKEPAEGSETDFEAVEMKKGLIKRAAALSADNKRLKEAIMEKKWNVMEKEEILKALKECENRTEETSEKFFGKVGNGFADSYQKEREAA